MCIVQSPRVVRQEHADALPEFQTLYLHTHNQQQAVASPEVKNEQKQKG